MECRDSRLSRSSALRGTSRSRPTTRYGARTRAEPYSKHSRFELELPEEGASCPDSRAGLTRKASVLTLFSLSFSRFQGGRTDKDIVKYLKKQTEPAYVTVNTAAELEAFRARDGTEVLGVFADLDSAEAKAFLATAEELRNDYTFGVSTNAEFATANSASVPALLLFKGAADSAPSVTTESSQVESQSAQKAWVQAEAFELVGEIGPENFQKYLDRGLPIVWCFLDFSAEKADATKQLLAEIEQAAASQKGKLSVVKLDGQRWAEHAKHFGLSGSKLPGIVVEDRASNKNFIFPESAHKNTPVEAASGAARWQHALASCPSPISSISHAVLMLLLLALFLLSVCVRGTEVTSASLSAHLSGFLAGTLKANLKSQAEPTDNNGPVVVLVGTNFERIVLDETKDVFVEF